MTYEMDAEAEVSVYRRAVGITGRGIKLLGTVTALCGFGYAAANAAFAFIESQRETDMIAQFMQNKIVENHIDDAVEGLIWGIGGTAVAVVGLVVEQFGPRRREEHY